jgi:hypothetical protein
VLVGDNTNKAICISRVPVSSRLNPIHKHFNYLYVSIIVMGNAASPYIVFVGLIIVISFVAYGYYRDSKDKFTKR